MWVVGNTSLRGLMEPLTRAAEGKNQSLVIVWSRNIKNERQVRLTVSLADVVLIGCAGSFVSHPLSRVFYVVTPPPPQHTHTDTPPPPAAAAQPPAPPSLRNICLICSLIFSFYPTYHQLVFKGNPGSSLRCIQADLPVIGHFLFLASLRRWTHPATAW